MRIEYDTCDDDVACVRCGSPTVLEMVTLNDEERTNQEMCPVCGWRSRRISDGYPSHRHKRTRKSPKDSPKSGEFEGHYYTTCPICDDRVVFKLPSLVMNPKVDTQPIFKVTHKYHFFFAIFSSDGQLREIRHPAAILHHESR